MVDRMKPTLIIDTREKRPINISCGRVFENIITEKLDTGDYSIDGLQEYLCIERKGSIQEFAQNVLQKRFTRELDRMNHKYSFVILEFTFDQLLSYPDGCGLPQKVIRKIKTNGKWITTQLIDLQLKYPHIHFIFVGNNAVEYITRICRKVVEAEWKLVV